MSVQVAGDTAYDFTYKDDPPFTDAQIDAMIAEYANLGLRWVRCTWNGVDGLAVKAPAAEYIQFTGLRLDCWADIRERVGYSGLFSSYNNSYRPGQTSFAPRPDWSEVVALIDAVYDAPAEVEREG